jgi:hypothetical protein
MFVTFSETTLFYLYLDIGGATSQKTVIFMVTPEFQSVVAFEGILHMASREIQLF